MPSPRLDEAEFKHRFRDQFRNPVFAALTPELNAIMMRAPVPAVFL
jgi:hypothetical protein